MQRNLGKQKESGAFFASSLVWEKGVMGCFATPNNSLQNYKSQSLLRGCVGRAEKNRSYTGEKES